jgi:hypothetical protein
MLFSSDQRLEHVVVRHEFALRVQPPVVLPAIDPPRFARTTRHREDQALVPGVDDESLGPAWIEFTGDVDGRLGRQAVGAIVGRSIGHGKCQTHCRIKASSSWMETVALEWISSLEVEPRDVVQFVQQLNNVPEDAVCEVGDIFSRPCRANYQDSGKQNVRRVRNEVHLSCELRVAEFLCKKFR